MAARPAPAYLPVPPFSEVYGEYRPVALPSPAAGHDLSYTVRGGGWILAESISLLYTADAGTSATNISLLITDADDHPLFFQQQAEAFNPGFATTYIWTRNLTVASETSIGNDYGQAAGPPFWLLPGFKIKTYTVSMANVDTITAVTLLKAEVYTGDLGQLAASSHLDDPRLLGD